MPVKIDPIINEQLQAMNLTLWTCIHPKHPFFNEKTGKMSQREDKSRVIVTLAGPGLPDMAHGFGGSLREAVDAALGGKETRERVPGLKGALLRLEAAMDDLRRTVLWEAIYTKNDVDPEDRDDFVPF